VPYRAAAQIELRTVATAHIMLYCTWRQSGIATGLHRQAVQISCLAKSL